MREKRVLSFLQILLVHGLVAHLFRDDVFNVASPAELHQRELQAAALTHHVWIPGVVVVNAREERFVLAVRQDRLLPALAPVVLMQESIAHNELQLMRHNTTALNYLSMMTDL